MVGKKTLRVATAALFAGASLGAGTVVHGATHGTRSAASGVVAITDWQFPDGCNQLITASVADQEICQPLESSLFGLDNHLNYYADLAESVPTVKNGGAKVVGGNLVVTYKLKPNTKWSDGQALTADDIKFSTQLTIATGATFGLDQIKSMDVVDARTLRVTYSGQYAPYVAYGTPAQLFPRHYLTSKYGTSDIAAIAKKAVLDNYNNPSDVFVGPYKLQSYTNGQSVVIVPDPNYTALPGPAQGRAAQIKFVNIAGDEASLVTALQSANAGVDKAEDFQFNDLPGLYSGKYKIQSQPALFFEHLELNQNGPLKDVRLRQALQYAIDKQTLFNRLFPGVKNASSFLMRTVIPNVSPYLNKSEPLAEYNPNKAKALLKAAGYATDYSGAGKHLVLRFATTPATVRKKDFQILSRYWANVGIHVSPNFASGDPAANNGMFSAYKLNGVLYQRRFDVALFAFSIAPDPQQQEETFSPDLIPTAASHAAGRQNYTGITDRDQFALLERARTTLDTAQRHALFNQWQHLLNQRVYYIPLYNRPNITADNGTVGNFKPNPGNSGNEWNAFQLYKS